MERDHFTYFHFKGSHSYDVYVYADKWYEENKNFAEKIFNVVANNRAQAARRVEKDGWFVTSVNMTG